MNARFRMLTALTTLGFASAARLADQDSPAYPPRFNMATNAGAMIPTGTLRDSFDTGLMLGAQGTYDVSTHLALLGSFDWANPTTKLVPADARANIYQADLGVELAGARGNTRRWAMQRLLIRSADARRDSSHQKRRGALRWIRLSPMTGNRLTD